MSRKIKSVLILAIGLGLAYWFVSRLDWHTVGTHLRSARIWPLVLAAILINLTMLLRSLRWQAFLAPISLAKLSNLFAATAVGFGGLFVIGRAGSEILRPAVLSLRERLRPSATIATILIERIYDTTSVGLLFAISLFTIEFPPDQAEIWQQFGGPYDVGISLLIAIFTGIGLLVLLRLKAGPIIGWLERICSGLPQKLTRPFLNFVRHLADGLSVLLNFRELAVTIFYTACVWGLISSATWLTLYAFGMKFSAGHIFFVLGFGLVGSLIPTPGGSAGAFHAAASRAFEFLGMEQNLAASTAIVYHLIAFGPPFIIALYYLVRDEISLSQLREIIASEGQVSNQKTGKKAGVPS